MNRRGFIGTLAAATAGLMLDPERALWVPGQKRIFLPSPRPVIVTDCALQRGDIFTVSGLFAINPRTYQTMPHLQSFIITADVDAGEFPLSAVCPQPITAGVYQNVNRPVWNRERVSPLLVGRTLFVGQSA